MDIFDKDALERCGSFEEWSRLLGEHGVAERDKRVAKDEQNLRRFRLDDATDMMIERISRETDLTKAAVVRRFVRLGIERYCQSPAEEIRNIQMCC